MLLNYNVDTRNYNVDIYENNKVGKNNRIDKQYLLQ